ncbi:small multi-drug export protein [Bacillus sp. H-16]|uniref:small multi-drug export protein n=1 Tax=Alteribacter salitolerans TaxID=2912333 RepID=UPI00196457CF|nr:small multi-drug export protein [Alteribacter salitolerans]MBM7097458.1 small multi-drug export protein [Alteribacter salitolerans]
MTTFIAYVVVFLLAATPFFEMIAVIPLGVAAGLHVVPVTILAFAGNVVTVLLVILLINQIQAWLKRRREAKGKDGDSKREGRAKKVWKRFGLPGLAIAGPFFIGSHLAALMGMSFGGTKKRMAVWMVGSLTIWCLVTAVASHIGIDLFFTHTDREGFLVDYLDQ